MNPILCLFYQKSNRILKEKFRGMEESYFWVDSLWSR